MFKLIIFDLDGTLVDSHPLIYEAYNRVFSEYGHPVSRKKWIEWIHESGGWIEKWFKLNNLKLNELEIRTKKKVIFNELIQTKMQLRPGAKELVELLYKKSPLIVASGSRLESIDLCLQKFNLTGKFQHIISDLEMERAKPHPDVFLYAAKMMNVEPKDCLVFEDSIAGLQSAKSAGMKCIICPDNFSILSKEQYQGADKIVSQLSEVNLDTIKSISEN